MVPDKELNIFEKYVIFSENNSKVAKIFGYGIASFSLAIALYRIRPFTKFTNPSSIPSRFMRKKVQLQGTVVYVNPSSGTLLMVDHKPLIPLPGLSNSTYLPVKISGLDVTSNGISWLQFITGGKNIIFTPLAKEKDYVSCIVCMQQNQERINIGKELVKLGFAVTEDNSIKTMIKDKDTLNYLTCLWNAQKWAQRKRNGDWHFARDPTLSWRIQQNLNEKLKSIVPKFIAQQLNI